MPLTHLSEDEQLFRDTIRRFAKEQIAPLVRGMDEAACLDKALLRQLFELGLMGIEIPEEYGGQGGNFFQCVLAIEEYDVKPMPEADGEYALGTVPLRDGFKTIDIVQPDGVSFTVDGNRISWLDWELSASLDAQEGLVIHDVRFKGRRILHRASCAEMIVPYGDPHPMHNWRTYFDAGEYGLGFLVVAREIRRLADQTAVASLDIEQMVKEMQHSVSSGVMEMDKFAGQVRSSVSEISDVSSKLGEIITAVHGINGRFEQVTEGMRAQSQGAAQIREAMIRLSEGASRTASSLEDFNKATTHLRGAVGDLKEEVSRFTI